MAVIGSNGARKNKSSWAALLLALAVFASACGSTTAEDAVAAVDEAAEVQEATPTTEAEAATTTEAETTTTEAVSYTHLTLPTKA